MLTRQFALLSFVVVGLISGALWVVISRVLQRDLLDREWGLTADYIRTEAHQRLTPADFVSPGDPASQQHFREFYQQAVMMPEIVRVKVYDARMTVVWSDEQRLIGQSFPDNPHLAGALAGRTMVNLETGGDRKGENVYEGLEFPSLVEVYVPVTFEGAAGVAGVVETYKHPRQVFANIRRGRFAVAGTALAGGALLYLSLFWIVRRAARRIDAQHVSLVSTNEKLQGVQAQLVETERMAAIGEVVAAVAHGIRNPLANIRASAQVAQLECRTHEASAPTAARSLADIVMEADRLEARLKELLQFVRPTERRAEPVDLGALLRSALDLMNGRLADTGVIVKESLASGLPPILGDPMLLEQVFVSIIGNAIEAMAPRGGTLTLATGRIDDAARGPQIFAEISDTGMGIAPADVARVFEPFYTTKAQGTGLGLAMARKFTEAHGGTIAVNTQPGAGSVFRVAFPAASGG